MTTELPALFHLQRHHDVSGISGTGVVALGVRWPDGTASVRWLGARPSIVFWDSMADAEAVHGHAGATEIVWDFEQAAAALSAPTDRAAIYREVAEELAGIDFHPNAKSQNLGLCRLLAGRFRRKADEVESRADEAQPEPEQRCVCGDPIELRSEIDPSSWIHSPGSDTPCLEARPRPATPDVDGALRIVSAWVYESNDSGGIDADDLTWRLAQAGYQLPEEEQL